jgi:dTDP-4-amino-4,6-dideoxygalactose transaminase
LPGEGLPVTDAVVGRILTLPLYPELSDDEVNQVIAAMQTYNWRQR